MLLSSFLLFSLRTRSLFVWSSMNPKSTSCWRRCPTSRRASTESLTGPEAAPPPPPTTSDDLRLEHRSHALNKLTFYRWSLCAAKTTTSAPQSLSDAEVEKMFHTFSRHWRRKSLKWTVQRGAGIRTRRIEVNVFCVRRPTVVMRKWLPFDLNHLHVYVSHLINVMSHANISIESANIKDITGCRLVPLLLLLFFLFFFANLQSTCLSKSAYKFK